MLINILKPQEKAYWMEGGVPEFLLKLDIFPSKYSTMYQ